MDNATRIFGPFELKLATGALRKNGQPVALQPQPARVLIALVSRAGELVTRDELRAAVWGTATHVDFDRGLNYCIRHLRAALGDSAREPQFIETVARRGYRFAAPLTFPRPKARLSRRAFAAAVVIATMVMESGGSNESHHRTAVAVLTALHDLLF